MKYLYAVLVFCVLTAHAQPKKGALKVTYERTSNGNPVEPCNPVVVFADALQTLVTSKAILEKKARFPFEQSYLDRHTGLYYQWAQLTPARTTATVDSTAFERQRLEMSPDTKTILGYLCHRAKTVINSNNIDIWFTVQPAFKGAPGQLGQNLGLVLEVTRNGNYTIRAAKIEKLSAIPKNLLPPKRITTVDMLTYRDQLWKSRFTIVPVFEKEIINFTDNFGSNDSIFRFAHGTVIVRKVKMPVISPSGHIFLDVTEQSNGDAYDRTGSVFLIPTDNKLSFLDGLRGGPQLLPVYDNGNGKKYQGVVRASNYSPPLELMRFFTPFGIKHYNTIQIKDRTWQDSVYYRQDVTDLAPALSGKEVWVGASVANYDKGGHRISVHFTVHGDEDAPASGDDIVLPLFNTNNILEAAGQEYATMFSSDKGLEASFSLKAPLKQARLRYITTGHGGWEHGDEFLQKVNAIALDGKEVFAFTPWRTDCGSYRTYNPASGNFENGMSSSDYSRSNWCPGTTTNPVYINLGDLPAGDHTISVRIPMGKPEGGSFSAWNVSGALIGRQDGP